MSSSRFVSGGTDEQQPTERDQAWTQAQREIEERREQQQQQQHGLQEGGKSLYETLQANKAAKQEAFEESARLRNQFRSLDEDEVDFLDSVLESTRARDDAIRRETREQLASFRRLREDADRAAAAAAAGAAGAAGAVRSGSGGGNPAVAVAELGAEEGWDGEEEGEEWTMRKRKRKGGTQRLRGMRFAGGSSTPTPTPASGTGTGTTAADGRESGPRKVVKVEVREGTDASNAGADEKAGARKTTTSAAATAGGSGGSDSLARGSSVVAPPRPPAGLGLGAYSSDEDD